MFVLDTNIALYQLGERLATPLPVGDFLISVITEIELLSFPSIGDAELTRVRTLLQDVAVAELSSDIKETAILLRRTHKLKTPDAIIAATALVHDAELLTNDKRILAVPAIRGRSVELRA